MRTPYRIATTAVALAAVFPIGVGPAQAADSLTEPAAAAAYYSRTTPAKEDAMPADPGPPFVGLNTDRVGKDNLAVAVAVPNESDKESFVRFDLPTLMQMVFDGQTVTIDKATLTVPLVPNDANNASAAADPAKVKACAADGGFTDVDAAAYDDRPTFDCKRLNAVATATPDGKAYTFDVTPLAKTWLTELNDGIALIPATMSQPFQIVFGKRETVTLAVEYTATAPVDPVDPVDPLPTTPPLPPVDTNTGTGTYVPPAVTGGTGTGTAPQPQVTTAPQPTPTVAPRPAVAPPAQPITNVARSGFTEHNRPSAVFWLAAIAGVGLLGAMSLFLGTPEVPVSSSSVQNGVGRALDERRRVAGRTGFRTAARPV